MPKVDKCTRQRRAAIGAALARGHTRTEAATLAGISPSTLWSWLAEGAKPDGELRYRRMLEAVEAGEADCVRRALDTMEDLLGRPAKSPRRRFVTCAADPCCISCCVAARDAAPDAESARSRRRLIARCRRWPSTGLRIVLASVQSFSARPKSPS